jgi:hypothetical protein
MGPSASDTEKDSVHDKLMSLFAKAGYEVCGSFLGLLSTMGKVLKSFYSVHHHVSLPPGVAPFH